jgi:hypothetical protein
MLFVNPIAIYLLVHCSPLSDLNLSTKVLGGNVPNVNLWLAVTTTLLFTNTLP